MTTRQHAVRLLVVAVLATSAGIGWWFAGAGAPAATRAATGALATDMPQAASPASRPSAAPPPKDLPPMPPANLPLRDAIAPLQARADAGDAASACRLGIELLRCAHLQDYALAHDDDMARQERALEAKGDLDGANRIAMGRLSHAQLRDTCAGVPDALVADAFRYVRQAALAGEPEAMVRYASGEPLVAGVGMAFETRPAFDVWRREARTVLARALAEGHPEAALLLAETHLGRSFVLGMLVPRDPVEAGASVALVHRLFGDDPALARLPPPPELNAEQAAAASRQAADWHERGFQGRRLVLAESTAALLPLHRRPEFEDPDSAWPGTVPLAPCRSSPQDRP